MHRAVRIVGIVTVASMFLAAAAAAQTTGTQTPATQTPATQTPPPEAKRPVVGTTNKDWEGFYAGGEIGLLPRSFDLGSSVEAINQISGVNVAGRGIVVVPAATATIPASSPGDTAFLAGVLAGYSRQFDKWVGGVEGSLDFGFGSTSSTFTSTLPATLLTPGVPVTFDRNVSGNIAWSLRGRVGYLYNDFLIYGTAGLAGVRLKLSATDTWTNVPGGPAATSDGIPPANLGPLGPYVTTAEETHQRVGFTFGGGVEKPVTDTLMVGAEFRHTGFGSQDFQLANPSIAVNGPLPAGGSPASAIPAPVTVNFTENRFTVHVTMKFDFWKR